MTLLTLFLYCSPYMLHNMPMPTAISPFIYMFLENILCWGLHVILRVFFKYLVQ
uniref:Uncharacterized protein n=1 Tax=Rhizophora mucronata TaxID=61149 RepID=A0A2P2LLI3_RHIMU